MPEAGLLYFDSSTLVKLVVAEPETEALQAYIRGWDGGLVSSALARAEVVRAAQRRRAPVARAEEVLDALTLVDVTDGILGLAATLAPTFLRTLDAVHLATALTLGPQIARFVAYDAPLLLAVGIAGLAVAAPGVSDVG